MARCLKEKCPHYNFYEGYELFEPHPFCNLYRKRTFDDVCIPLNKKDEMIERLACKMSNLQREIDAYNQLELLFRKEELF